MTTKDNAPSGIRLSSIAHLYGIPALLLVVGLSILTHVFIPTVGGVLGTQATATVFANVRELRLDELPRSMSTVFERATVLEAANRSLEEQGFAPISSLGGDQIVFDPIEGTPFARVVAVDRDRDRAEAVAVSLARALVEDSNAIGPTFGEFEMLPEVQFEAYDRPGLAPLPRMVVAALAAVLITAALLLALLALRRPAIDGVRLPFPVVVVTNTAPWQDELKLSNLLGSGRVADLILTANGPVYLASQSSRSLRSTLASRLARQLRIELIDDTSKVVPGVLALGELNLSKAEDVGHRLVGQDPRIILLAREGSRLRPLVELADQFQAGSILGLVIERRRYHLFSQGPAGDGRPSSDAVPSGTPASTPTATRGDQGGVGAEVERSIGRETVGSGVGGPGEESAGKAPNRGFTWWRLTSPQGIPGDSAADTSEQAPRKGRPAVASPSRRDELSDPVGSDSHDLDPGRPQSGRVHDQNGHQDNGDERRRSEDDPGVVGGRSRDSVRQRGNARRQP